MVSNLEKQAESRDGYAARGKAPEPPGCGRLSGQGWQSASGTGS
jgi:hypothetical protein